MKTLKTVWHSSLEFMASKPWLFLLLIPIFCTVLPTPITKPFLLQAFNKVLPHPDAHPMRIERGASRLGANEIHQQFTQSEAEIIKVFRSSGAAILLWLTLKGLQRSTQLPL
jgi:hypothetical protein